MSQKLDLFVIGLKNTMFSIQRYKLDLCNNMDLPGMTRDDDKLKKLQHRLAQPSSLASEGLI